MCVCVCDKVINKHIPALCHPKDILLDEGLEASQMAKREMRNPAKSESM